MIHIPQDDPAFEAANDGAKPQALTGMMIHPSSAHAGGGGGHADLNLMRDMDPLSVLALVKEYVISRSPQLSARHYLDAQRVANRVWSQHFRHKHKLRGKVGIIVVCVNIHLSLALGELTRPI